MSPQPHNSRPPVALVTGASRGLGRGIALELAAEGYSVAINFAGNHGAAAETARLCLERAAAATQRFEPMQADIGTSAGRRQLVDETLARLGAIDALVNNAGIAPRIRADVTEADEESFDTLIRTNLAGPHFLTQLVARHWLASGRPCAGDTPRRTVVFISSVSANTASLQRAEYCISKAGLAMSAQLWAARLAAEGIVVVELRPGIMATEMTVGVKTKYDELIEAGLVPQRRWGTAEDVGLAVRSILAGDFPFSTGAVIPLDGGLGIRRL